MWTCRCPATDCFPKTNCACPGRLFLEGLPEWSFRWCHQGINVCPFWALAPHRFYKKMAWIHFNGNQQEYCALWCLESVAQEGARDGRCTWVVYKSRTAASWTCADYLLVYCQVVFSPQSEPQIWSRSLVKLLLLLHFHLVQIVFTQHYVKQSRQCKHTSWCWKLCSSFGQKTWGNLTTLPQQLPCALLNLFIFVLVFLQIQKKNIFSSFYLWAIHKRQHF